MGAAGQLISFTLPHVLDANRHPFGKSGQSTLHELGGQRDCGRTAYWGGGAGPGWVVPGWVVPGPFGFAPPLVRPPQAVPVLAALPAHSAGAFTLSSVAVETGKIWSVSALRTVTRTAFGNCATSCQVSCQTRSRPAKAKET